MRELEKPHFPDEGKRTGHEPNTCALSSGDDNRWLNWYRNENRWLGDRVEELTRQLRLRTIMLAGALALSTLVVVGSFYVAFLYEPPPTISLEVPPPPDARGGLPPLAGKGEHSLELPRSHTLAPIAEAVGALEAANARSRAAIANLEFVLKRAEALREQRLASLRDGESKALITGASGARRSQTRGPAAGTSEPNRTGAGE